MKSLPVANWISTTLSLCALTLFGLGVFSLSWPRTMGIVGRSETQRVVLQSYGTKAAHGSTTLDVEETEYSYSVGGQQYSNSQICFCLPLGWKNHVAGGSTIEISYFRKNPRWSVLYPGPDLLSIGSLLVASALTFLGGKAAVRVFDV
jgi:hypothetical protein